MAIARISGHMLYENLDRSTDLAFKSNLLYLDIDGHRVGVNIANPAEQFHVNGNARIGNVLISGNTITSDAGFVNFGSISNVKISGGSANYVVYTDGLGNLAFGQISEIDPAFGNVVIADNRISINQTDGNLELRANGSGYLDATGVDSWFNNLISQANIQVTQGYLVGNVDANYLNITSNAFAQNGIQMPQLDIGFTDSNGISTTTGNLDLTGAGNIRLLSNTRIESNVSIFGNTTVTNLTGEFIRGNLNANNAVIANVAEPVTDNDAATKYYVDSELLAYQASNVGINNTYMLVTDSGTGNIAFVNDGSNVGYITGGNLVFNQLKLRSNVVGTTEGGITIAAGTDNANNVIAMEAVSAVYLPAGTTAQRPVSPVSGYFRYNYDLSTVEWFAGNAWVSAGGGGITSQVIQGDGINDTFTLDRTTTAEGIFVHINGTSQDPGNAYTVSGDQITFAEVPTPVDTIEVRFLVGGVISAPFAGGNILAPTWIVNSTIATSYTSGALRVDGGVGIGGNAFINGNLVASSGTISTDVSTGALVVIGGAGISGNVYTDKMYTTSGVFWAGNGVSLSTPPAGSTGQIQYNTGTTFGGASSLFYDASSGNLVITDTTTSGNLDTGALVVKGGIGVGNTIIAGGNIVASSGTNSTTSSTGALVVVGGAGISQNLNVDGNIITGTTAATSITTGAVVVQGGLGVAGNIAYNTALLKNNNLGSVSGTVNIDLLQGAYVTATLTGTTTFTVSNAHAAGSFMSAFVLELYDAGGRTVNFMSGITWVDGTPPTLTTGGTDILTFYTKNAGTTWRGLVAGLNLS